MFAHKRTKEHNVSGIWNSDIGKVETPLEDNYVHGTVTSHKSSISTITPTHDCGQDIYKMLLKEIIMQRHVCLIVYWLRRSNRDRKGMNEYLIECHFLDPKRPFSHIYLIVQNLVTKDSLSMQDIRVIQGISPKTDQSHPNWLPTSLSEQNF